MSKPIDFKESNLILKPSEQKYSNNIGAVRDLPIWTNNEQCVSCWKLSFKERLSALLFGKVWVGVVSGNTQPPVYVVCHKEHFEVE